MITIKPVTLELKDHFKTTRLRALRDSPLAFGSTYAKESLLTDSEWEERIAKWTGDRSAAFLAFDHGRSSGACGIVAGYFDADDPSVANLVSMWVAPTHRRAGIGTLLVSQIIDWAGSHQAASLRLMVTSINVSAKRFYERLGFSETGKTEPYPNDSSLIEYEMERQLG